MLRAGRATVLALNASSIDRVAASLRFAHRGVHLVLAQSLDAVVRVLETGTVVAIALCPPLATAESFAVASALRRRVRDVPVAIVLGQSRIDGGDARVLWLTERPIAPAVLAAVGELAEMQCSDWIELTGDAESDQVPEIMRPPSRSSRPTEPMAAPPPF
jgi:hypothetical protein